MRGRVVDLVLFPPLPSILHVAQIDDYIGLILFSVLGVLHSLSGGCLRALLFETTIKLADRSDVGEGNEGEADGYE